MARDFSPFGLRFVHSLHYFLHSWRQAKCDIFRRVTFTLGGGLLLAFSILSTVLGCIRMGQNRRKLENLLDETRHEDVLQWIHQHHRMHNSKSFKIFSPKNIEHFYYFCRILTIVQNFRNLSCSSRVDDCALALFALVMTRPSNVKSGLRKYRF